MSQHLEQAPVHLTHAPNVERHWVIVESAAGEPIRRSAYEIGRMSNSVLPAHSQFFHESKSALFFNGVRFPMEALT
jgi:hypothetical protein